MQTAKTKVLVVDDHAIVRMGLVELLKKERDIVVVGEAENGEEAVVIRTVYPRYRGALVVCQGGDRADVKLAVTEAVAALTGLSADRITVARCQ